MRDVLLALLVAVATASTPSAGADAAHGKTLYSTICAACHGPAREGAVPMIAAGKPQVILNALRTVRDMSLFAGLITSTDAADIAAYLAEVAGILPPTPTLPAVEFYNAALDHFFTTSIPAEIAGLDAGRPAGWQRTGGSFGTWASAAVGTAGASPVCRIYIPPAFGNSHFYSASPTECAAVRERFPAFVFEADEVMAVLLPNPITGACAGGTQPVFRLWNMRADTNHRYTTDRDVRTAMIGRGHVPEGYGDDGVAFCAPAAAGPANAQE